MNILKSLQLIIKLLYCICKYLDIDIENSFSDSEYIFYYKDMEVNRFRSFKQARNFKANFKNVKDVTIMRVSKKSIDEDFSLWYNEIANKKSAQLEKINHNEIKGDK